LEDLASPERVLEKSKRWAPHRSLASVYLWTAVKLKLTADDLRAPRRRVA
jgi:3-methyladenine DNA glycosylase/8-oxoguanine DNA glycosylase